MLVVETIAARPLPGRRRRRPAQAEGDEEPPRLPLTRTTIVRAATPFAAAAEADDWLDRTVAEEEEIDDVLAEGLGLLNRALFIQAAAAAEPHMRVLSADDAEAVRIGYGSGEEVAAGHYTAARLVDARSGGRSRRRRRSDGLRPQERVAAVLGGRERVDACEPLLLRARADLDAGRRREATLQLRVGLEALLVELRGALRDDDHERDMVELGALRGEIGAAANAALEGDLDPDSWDGVRRALETCERVLRRRRVLRGG